MKIKRAKKKIKFCYVMYEEPWSNMGHTYAVAEALKATF